MNLVPGGWAKHGGTALGGDMGKRRGIQAVGGDGKIGEKARDGMLRRQPGVECNKGAEVNWSPSRRFVPGGQKGRVWETIGRPGGEGHGGRGRVVPGLFQL